MRKHLIAASILLFSFAEVKAQETFVYRDEERSLKTLREFMQKKDYGFAYTLAKELKKEPRLTNPEYFYQQDEIELYRLVCGLALQQDITKEEAEFYLANSPNESGRRMLAFYLGHYAYTKGDYANVLKYYDYAGFENLSNEQLAQAKFEKAVALFNTNDYAAAKPLFNEIHQIPGSKYYNDANYYYGYLSYLDKDYANALQSLQTIENTDAYKGIAPYYIADIYYNQGQKDKAMEYGATALQNGMEPYYAGQLNLLIGQLYFEKEDYAKALPLLRSYVSNSDKVSKEVMYELSYANYKTGNDEEAIKGFRQLSSEQNELGQNSMFILGNLYLKRNDKENARNAFQYSAYNSSNKEQQRISLFNYAKLSYELGYQDVALKELQNYLAAYPASSNDAEAKSILIDLLANTNNYSEAMKIYQSISNPPATAKAALPKIRYGYATQLLNNEQLQEADELLAKVIADPSAGDYAVLSRFWRGEIAYRNRDYRSAINHLQAYIAGGGLSSGEANQKNARYILGYSQMALEDFTAARQNFASVASSADAAKNQVERDAWLRNADAVYMLKNYSTADGMYAQVVNGGWQQADYAQYQRAMIAGLTSSSRKIAMLADLDKNYPSSGISADAQMEIAQTYLADEKFAEALPFLDNVIRGSKESLKPAAYQKQGAAYYNLNRNNEALNSLKQVITKYPNSPEADDAGSLIRSIYVEEGRADEYLSYMSSLGKNVNYADADSLSYAAALQKWNDNSCNAGADALGNYVAKYPDGRYVTDASYYVAECRKANKRWDEAIKAYDKVIIAGLNKFYEPAALEVARIYYFNLEKYDSAAYYFEMLNAAASTESFKLEALRGLVRSYYNNRQYSKATSAASALLENKNITNDDKAIALLVLAKSQQLTRECDKALRNYKQVISLNKGAWAAEARYETANCLYEQNKLKEAEAKAMEVIKLAGGYDYWVTKAYILLGDIFLKQKDYFNAKATYQSVAANAVIKELKDEASRKAEQAANEEKQNSKLN